MIQNVTLPRILIVDDDDEIRATLRFLLEDAGYQTLEAEHADAALAVLRDSEDSLVALVDYLLPRNTGLDLLRQALSDSTVAHRHAFVLLTASSRYDDINHELAALAGGRIPAVRKPFDIDTLLGAVRQASDRLLASGSAAQDEAGL